MFNNTNIIKKVKKEVINELSNGVESKVKSYVEMDNDVPELVFMDNPDFKFKEEINNEELEILDIKQEDDNDLQYEDYEEEHEEKLQGICSYNIDGDAKMNEEFVEISDNDEKIDISEVIIQSSELNQEYVKESDKIQGNIEEQNNIKKHKCEFCTKRFIRDVSLEDHLLKKHKDIINSDPHDFIKNQIYQCKACEYATTFKMCLDQHINLNHDNDKKDKPNTECICQFCSQTFSSNISLEDHMLKQHKELVQDNEQEFVTSVLYKCKTCTYLTVFSNCLNWHQNKAHAAHESDMRCRFCYRSYLTKSFLEYHLQQKHNKDIKKQ